MENNETEKVALAEVADGENQFDPTSFMEVEDIEVRGSKKEVRKEDDAIEAEAEVEEPMRKFDSSK